MSAYNKDGPLTPKQLARIKRGIAGAHALGGPTYADCKAILGRQLNSGPQAWHRKWRKQKADPQPKSSTEVEARRKDREEWFGGLP